MDVTMFEGHFNQPFSNVNSCNHWWVYSGNNNFSEIVIVS